MGIYPERPSERNIDQLADDIRVVTELDLRAEGFPNPRVLGDSTDGFPVARELPPKYEDLDQPPKYDEQMFLATSQAGASSIDETLPTYSSTIPNGESTTNGNNSQNRN